MQIAMHLLNENCIKVYLEVGMEKFVLQKKKKETENKTIRFPVELISEIEEFLVGTDETFSSFVIQACQYALDNREKE